MSVKWKMINNKTFQGEKDGYVISVRLDTFLPVWFIFKDSVVIDECFKYSPTKDELTCKVQAERILNKILLTQHTKQ